MCGSAKPPRATISIHERFFSTHIAAGEAITRDTLVIVGRVARVSLVSLLAAMTGACGAFLAADESPALPDGGGPDASDAGLLDAVVSGGPEGADVGGGK